MPRPFHTNAFGKRVEILIGIRKHMTRFYCSSIEDPPVRGKLVDVNGHHIPRISVRESKLVVLALFGFFFGGRTILTTSATLS